MRLINRWCSSFNRLSGFGFQDQIPLAIAVLGHLALFQLVDTSTQSSTSLSSAIAAATTTKMSLPLGNDSKYALPKGRCRGQDVISLVPEKDRGLFVFYHLEKALNSTSTNKNIISSRVNIELEIPKNKAESFKDIPTYDTFSADLLNWAMQTFDWSEFNVNNNNMLLRRYRVVCTSKGLCFSPIDIGYMCCPF